MSEAEITKKSQDYYNASDDLLYVDLNDENYIGVDDVHLDHSHYIDDDDSNIDDSNDIVAVLDFEDIPEEEEMIIEEPDQNDLVFMLPDVPGAEDAEEIEIEKEPEETAAEMWDWGSGGVGNFLYWLHNMMNSPPQHSGRDTTGLEKAISYFEALDKEITKAMRTDYKNEIDSAKAEEARAAIEDGLERLIDRLEKVKSNKFKRHNKKKKADIINGLVKEGQKATHVGGIIVTVPLLISRVARTCINGMVSAGHDIEDLFQRQAEMYNLDKREKAEVLQLLADMGYPLRRDRGLDFDDEFNPTSSENMDFATNYNG